MSALSSSKSGRINWGENRNAIGWAMGSVLAVVALAALGACFAAVTRGIDLTDESLYVVSSLYPKRYLVTSSDFQLLTGPLLGIVHHVWIMRIVGLVALLGASVFFALAFLSTAPSLLKVEFKGPERLAVGSTLVVGALLPFVWEPQTLGYDQLTFLVLLVSSSVLLLLAAKRIGRRAEPVAWVAVGALAWVQLLVKWPALAAMVPLVALALWRSKPRPWSTPRAAGLVVAGVVLAALITSIFVGLPTILEGLRQGGTVTATSQGHGVGKLLHQYVLQLRHLTWTMVAAYWYLLGAGVLGGVLCAVKRTRRGAAIALGIALTCLTPVLILDGRVRGGIDPYGQIVSRGSVLPAYVAFAVVAGTVAYLLRRRFVVDRRILFTCSLLLLPFLSALGTDNYIWTNALFAASFWLAGALALASMSFGEFASYPVRGLAFALCTLVAFTAVDGTWSNPYRQAPLGQDNDTLTIAGPLNGLAVDHETATFLESVQDTVQATPGYRDSTMVEWAEMPGTLLAAGLPQPYRVWVIEGSAPAQRALGVSCQSSSEGVFFLDERGGPDPVTDPAAFPATCGGRSWVLRSEFIVPRWVPVLEHHVELYFAGPTGARS